MGGGGDLHPRWPWARSIPRSPTSRCPRLPPTSMSARPKWSGWSNVYQIAPGGKPCCRSARSAKIVGYQRMYLGGVLLFTLASLGCALGVVAGQPC